MLTKIAFTAVQYVSGNELVSLDHLSSSSKIQLLAVVVLSQLAASPGSGVARLIFGLISSSRRFTGNRMLAHLRSPDVIKPESVLKSDDEIDGDPESIPPLAQNPDRLELQGWRSSLHLVLPEWL